MGSFLLTLLRLDGPALIATLVAYALAGVCATVVAYRMFSGRKAKLLAASFVFTAFFSISFAVGRMAVPLPTSLVAAAWLADLASVPNCIPNPDGCVPHDQGYALIFIPFMLQWAFWWVIFAFAAGTAPARRPDPGDDFTLSGRQGKAISDAVDGD